MPERLDVDMIGTVTFTLTVDGAVVEEVTEDDPIEYLHGADNIVPGMETALQGKAAGDSFDVMVQPAEGYGDYDEDLLEEVPKTDFDDLDELEEGMAVDVFDEEGEMFEASVREIKDDVIVLDFNPEFAGKTLHYKGKVIGVREATAQEVSAGFPQSLLDEMMAYEEMDDDE